MQRLLTNGLLFFLLAVAVLDANAQWPRGKGKGYAQFSFGRSTATKGYDADGNTEPLGLLQMPEDYSENAGYLYFEYGLSDKATLVGSTFGKAIDVEALASTHSTSGLADLTLLLRYTVSQTGALVVSPQIGLKLPLGYDSEAEPPLGSGSTDLLAEAALGLSLHPAPAYLTANFGIKVRGGTPENE